MRLDASDWVAVTGLGLLTYALLCISVTLTLAVWGVLLFVAGVIGGYWRERRERLDHERRPQT